MRVHVPRLRSDAVVLEGPSKGRVRVAVGPLKLWVESEGLATPSPERARGDSDNRAAAERGVRVPGWAARSTTRST